MSQFNKLKDFVKDNKPEKESEIDTLLSEYQEYELEQDIKYHIQKAFELGVSKVNLIKYYDELSK